MNKQVKAMIFDFDGTLADTAPDMVAALNDWLDARGRPPVDIEEASRYCSGGSRALLEFCGTNGEDMQGAIVDYLERYERTDYQRTKLYCGVAELLTALAAAGMPWGVATNKPERYFAPIAKRLLMQFHPAALVCRDDKGLPAKPHPATLLAAAAQCGVAVDECLYVGDDVRDGFAAQAAGMPFVGVTWGYWLQQQWIHPSAVAAVVSLPKILCIFGSDELIIDN